MTYDFEYDRLWVKHFPETGRYWVTSLTYGSFLGIIALEDGPGYVLEIPYELSFIDAGDMRAISDLLLDLNSTL